MTASVTNYINVIDSETVTIGQLLTDMVRSSWVITNHCVLTYFETKELLKMVKKEAKTSTVYLDKDLLLVERLEAMQVRLKEQYHRLRKEIFFARLFLRKTFDVLGLVIIAINEHDADVDIASGSVSKPFSSVDELMKHLHS